MIESHLDLPHEVAKRLQTGLCGRACYDDLVSLGLVGLCDAARRFDSSRGVSFRTYARHRIRGEILDGLRLDDPISRADRRLFKRSEQAVHGLTASLGRLPDELEIAQAMTIPLRQWQRFRTRLGHLGLLAPGRKTPELDDIPDRSGDPQDGATAQQTRERLAQLIEALPVRNRLVIRLHYEREMTFAEIGKRLGVGPSRVSQIHKRALTKLREQLRKSGNLTGLFTNAAR